MKRVWVLVLTVATVLALPRLVAAEETTGTVEVRVVDRVTHRPVENAQVTLLGPQAAVALTDRDGVVRFEDLPVATYSVGIRRRGYAEQRSERFDVRGAQRRRVDVELDAHLVEIGRTRSVPIVRVDLNTIDDRNPVRRVSDTLLDALGALAGVSVDQSSLGGIAISLRNGGAGQTGLSINGLRIAGGISSSASNAGLFTGASVDFSPSSSGLAGAVDLRAAQPTKAWRLNADTSYGSYARFDDHFTVTGTSGKLGVAITHGGRGLESVVTGLRYADASGLTYVHDGASRGDGNYVTLTYGASARTTLKLSGLASANSGTAACSAATTVLPCGDGPGSIYAYNYRFGLASVQSQLGNLVFDAYVYTNDNVTEYDQTTRLIARVPAGTSSDVRSTYDGGAVSASTSAGRHQLALSFSSARGRIAATQRYAALQAPSDTRQIDDRLELEDALKLGARVTATATATHAPLTDAGRTTLGNLKLVWRPQRATAFDASFATGSGSSQTVTQATWSAPAEATFDCSAGTSFVRAPSDRAAAQHATSVSAGIRHTWRHGDAHVSVYRRDEFGTPLSLAVPFVAEAAVAPPSAGLLDGLAATWAQPTVCGGTPFDPRRAYAFTSLSGIGQRYAGATVDVRAGIGERTTIIASYAHAGAVLTHLDPRLQAPASFNVPGRQLDGRPAEGGSLTVDVRATPAAEVIVNARYTGIGNAANQPPTTVAAIGIVATTAHGSFTLLESNAFNAHTGLFATNQGMNPLPLAGGGTIALATRPLAPRQFILRYAVTAGRRDSP